LDLTQWPESREAWDKGIVTSLPLPYYGLESADFVGGHTTWVWGDYIHWLKAEHPDALPAVYGKVMIEDWTPKCGEHALKSAVPAELHYNRYIADRTCEFLGQKAADGRPFFCWCSFPDPHHSYVAPRPYCDWYDPAQMPLPTRAEGELDRLPPFYRTVYEEGAARWKVLSGRGRPTRHTDSELQHIWAMTYAMVSCTDAAIGLVLNRLEETGLARNTVVCFLADHGDMLGDHWIVNKGPFHFDGLLRMPLVWRWPGHIREGSRTPGLACQIDFAPTVLDLAGVPIPEGARPEPPEAPCQRTPWPGKSLAPQLSGRAERVRDHVIVENDEDYLGTNLRSYITDDYKLTVYSSHPDWGELFDRRNDPKELNNLWNDPKARSTRARLMQELLYAYLDEETPLPRRMTHA
jgi:arylsulfatase